jgi:hypothetical protein
LLAYEDPFTSPLNYLLKLEHRDCVSDALNSAILSKSHELRKFIGNNMGPKDADDCIEHLGIKYQTSHLERFMRHLSVCENQLQRFSGIIRTEFRLEKVLRD